jgi:predicted permease
MSTLRRWLARLVGSVVTGQSERELADELEAHLQLEIDELELQGMTPSDARREALIRSGGIEVAKEAYRRQRGLPVIDHARRDLLYAVRMIRRSPGFTFVAVLSLALAIAANTAVFSLTDAVFLKPLPVHEPRELVLLEWASPEAITSRERGFHSYSGSIRGSDAAGEAIGTSFSLPLFETLQAGTSTFSGLFAFAAVEQLNVVDADGAGLARGQLVTGAYYATLGVPALHGRTVLPDDDRASADPVAVLSHRFWQGRFGGDPSVVGRVVRLNGVPTTIIGVTPRKFIGTLDVGEAADVTLPMSLAPVVSPGRTEADLSDPGRWWVQLMGRRRAGVTIEEMEADLAVVFGRALRPVDAPSDARIDAGVMSPRVVSGAHGPHDERRDYRLATVLLTAVAALVLLLACTNVASLLLSRASARQAEITMRLALGAGRRRVIGQLLTEALVLALLAESLGLALAYWGKDLLLVLRPGTTGLDLHIDGRGFVVATLVAASTALLFGMAPAFHATRGSLGESLKSAVRTSRGRPRARLRSTLLVVQISVSVVLLFGSSLFVGTLRNLRATDVGFDQERLLLFRVDPRLSQYEGERVRGLYRELHRVYGEIPAVEAVSFSRHALLTGSRRNSSVAVLGQADSQAALALVNPVGPAFFETIGLRIVMGRALGLQDDERSPGVAVINESFARARLPGQEPLGRTLHVSGREWEIVGVAADAKYDHVRAEVAPTVYLPFLQTETGQASFVLRTATDPLTVVTSVRDATRSIDPTLTIFEVVTQRAAVEATFGEERVLATMTTAFAVLALFLAAIGVYGVMSFATSRRTGEIGLRVALGASGPSILWLVSRSTLALVILGVAVGLGASLVSSSYLTRLLYGLTATDVGSIVAAVGVISGAALLAAYVPANRASRVSPLEALRHE